jgi:adenosylcobinamide-phosphate synthase
MGRGRVDPCRADAQCPAVPRNADLPLADHCLLAFLALAIEAAVGYPDRLWCTIGHPVSWIGRIITRSEERFNRAELPPPARCLRGAICLAGWLALVLLASLLVTALVPGGLPGLLVLAILSSMLLAQRSLHAHVAAVADALDGSLAAGRTAVAHIVGRDVGSLDEAGVARAAIESLAENLSDGIVAPAFWIALGGLPGGALYKAINTADSLVGHRTPRLEAFGFAAAKLDDAVNWPAARLSGLFVALAALPDRVAAETAWRAMRRDAPHHRSPNAGWPEAAMAGVLGLRLSGPRDYAGQTVDDAFMGEGRREANAADIRAALVIYRRALALLWILLALFAVALR